MTVNGKKTSTCHQGKRSPDLQSRQKRKDDSMSGSYWDLEEHERARLTREEVEQYEAFELMSKGVPPLEELRVEDVPALPPPSRQYAKAKIGTVELYFDTMADVEVLQKMAPKIQCHQYLNDGWSGPSVEYVKDFGSPEGSAVRMYSEEEVERHKVELQKSKSIEERNKKARDRYDRAIKDRNEALAGMWSDWTTVRTRSEHLSKIGATYEDYVKTCSGDKKLAYSFLLKAFDEDDIKTAEEWKVAGPFPAVRDEAEEEDNGDDSRNAAEAG
jgi:hypothetical protein